jgi:hypothetical protein
MTTADHTQKLAASAVHGSPVHYRAAPQHRGDWLRRIDQWIAYANSGGGVTRVLEYPVAYDVYERIP